MPIVATATAHLAEVLATLYPDRASAERVAGTAGMNRTRIAYDPRPLNHWTNILAEAQVQGRYDALIATALAQYPGHQPLRDAVDALALALQNAPPAGPLDFDWVEIPAGEFLLGSDPARDPLAYPSELPQQRITLPTFYIARVPVTVAQFAAFVESTGHQTTAEARGFCKVRSGSSWKKVTGATWRTPHGPTSGVQHKQDHPVTSVSWFDAAAFCQWAGVRLPSELEWEKAARGPDGRIFPWGDDPADARRSNFDRRIGDTTPVTRYPAGASPYGVLDLSGNAWEWTASRWRGDYSQPADAELAGDAARVVRGGSFADTLRAVRCAARIFEQPSSCVDVVGLRAVRF